MKKAIILIGCMLVGGNVSANDDAFCEEVLELKAVSEELHDISEKADKNFKDYKKEFNEQKKLFNKKYKTYKALQHKSNKHFRYCCSCLAKNCGFNYNACTNEGGYYQSDFERSYHRKERCGYKLCGVNCAPETDTDLEAQLKEAESVVESCIESFNKAEEDYDIAYEKSINSVKKYIEFLDLIISLMKNDIWEENISFISMLYEIKIIKFGDVVEYCKQDAEEYSEKTVVQEKQEYFIKKREMEIYEIEKKRLKAIVKKEKCQQGNYLVIRNGLGEIIGYENCFYENPKNGSCVGCVTPRYIESHNSFEIEDSKLEIEDSELEDILDF